MLQINARLPGGPDGGIWESFPGPFKEDDFRLTLLDLFDWTPLGYIDLRFYVVLVDSFRSHPDKVGHHALVDGRIFGQVGQSPLRNHCEASSRWRPVVRQIQTIQRIVMLDVTHKEGYAHD